MALKIAVCLKRVPDTTTKIIVGADGKSIDENGVKFVPNPYDEYALEEALALKEKQGGETVVYSLGTDAAAETLRGALALGFDRAVLLQAGGANTDGLAVAQALAAELGAGGYDLILFGKMAVDDYNHQVGPMVAELLGLPCITAISHLNVADGAVEAEREIEGGIEVSSCKLPAVLTCDKGLNTPRLAKLQGIMAAKKKPLDTKPAALGGVTVELMRLELPPERKPGRIVGEGPDAVPALVDLLRSEAKVL